MRYSSSRATVRAVDQFVAVLEQRRLQELLHRVAHQAPVRVPEDEPGPDLLLDAEQVQLPAEHAVVAPARLREPLQVLVQRLSAEERGAVDTLQHLPAFVSPPVGARGGEQLEVLHFPGGRHVRPSAQVQERAVLVDRDHLVVGHLLQPLQLERVIGEELPALLLADAAPLEGEVGGDHLAHARLEGLQVFGREGFVHLEVVIEAVLDRGAEADTGAGTQLAHRGGQDVRGRVAQHGERVVVPAGEDAYLGARGDRPSQVDHLVVDHGRQGGAGQSGADTGRDVGGAAAARRLDGAAVGEPHLDGFVSHRSSGGLRGFGCFGTTVAEHTRRNANCARRRQNGKEPGTTIAARAPGCRPDQTPAARVGG